MKMFMQNMYDWAVSYLRKIGGIFVRIYALTSQPEEWKKIVLEKTDFVSVRKKYFFPVLFFSLFLSFCSISINFFSGDSEESYLQALLVGLLLSFLLYFTGFMLSVTLLSSYMQKYDNEGDAMSKSGLLLVFPYCMMMMTVVFQFLWSHLFILNYLMYVMAFFLVWNGFPVIYKKVERKTILVIVISALPFGVNTLIQVLFSKIF